MVTFQTKKGKDSIIHQANKYIALGEFGKGGDYPAGADEH